MSQEHTPLLSQSKSSSNSNAYPPFLLQGGKQPPPPPPYEAVEIIQHSTSTHQQRFGIASRPFIAIIVLAVGFILIFGLALNSPSDKQLISSNRNLKQSDPTTDNSGYKDITTPQGRLRGFTKKSREGRDYTAYYKVPYAEPPIGELRFKDPVPLRTTWQGLRAIPVVGPQCIQREKFTGVEKGYGDEDCLHSNIYVPEIPQQEPLSLPVMVYIFGGAFIAGNGSRYGADYFMDEDVILITINYRIGVLGYLNTKDDVIRGNMGFKDIVQMLKWTKDNIQHFGGDPNRVTLFGNSAGGMSIAALMISPMAKGLFHGGITQSGASLCGAAMGSGVLDKDPMITVQEVGRRLNCDPGNTTAFLECLQTKDAGEIVLIRKPPAYLGLTMENRSDDQAFMPNTPYNLLKSNPNRIPYMIGVVKSEWVNDGLGVVMDSELCKKLNDDFAGAAGEVLNLENVTGEELMKVKEFYFGDREIGNETFVEVMNMKNDRSTMHCAYVSAELHSKFSPTYLFYMSKVPGRSYADKIMGKAGLDVTAKDLDLFCHADEIQYLFPYDGFPVITKDDPEYFEHSRYLVKQWATFAANGAPSSDWESIHQSSSSSSFWFELNDKSGRTDVMDGRMNLWNQFTHQQLKYDH